MTQNTEQNVRTRDEQVADLVEALSDEVWVPDHKSYCEKMILEAEARGAEEQRRKDAEGPPIGYLITEHSGDGNQSATTFTKQPVSPEDMSEFQLTSLPVYDRPANVAALEVERDCYRATVEALLRAIEAPCPMDAHLDPSIPDPVEYAREMTNRRKALEAEIVSLKEAEQLARADAEASKARRAKDQEVIRWLAEALATVNPDLKSDCDLLIRAALTRDGEQA